MTQGQGQMDAALEAKLDQVAMAQRVYESLRMEAARYEQAIKQQRIERRQARGR